MPTYIPLNKNNLLHHIVHLRIQKYKQYLLNELKNQEILNESEFNKIKMLFEKQINIEIYCELNKLKLT